MDILAYPRQHPWITGAVVVIGGIVVLIIMGGLGSGGGSNQTSDGPSDAEVMAAAQIEAAKLNAAAVAGATAADIRKTEIGAGVTMHSDDLAAQIAMRNFDLQEKLGLSSISADRDIGLATINGQVSIEQSRNHALVTMNSSNNKQKNVGGLIGLGGSIIKGVFGLFSDQRLKENIVLVGYDDADNRIYEFNYKGSKTRRRGYIAQDLLKTHPHAVTIDNNTGYMMVDMWSARHAIH